MDLKKVKGIKFLESNDSTPFIKAEIILNIYDLADWLLKNHDANQCKIVIVEDKNGNLISLIKNEDFESRILRSKRKKELQ